MAQANKLQPSDPQQAKTRAILKTANVNESHEDMKKSRKEKAQVKILCNSMSWSGEEHSAVQNDQ